MWEILSGGALTRPRAARVFKRIFDMISGLTVFSFVADVVFTIGVTVLEGAAFRILEQNMWAKWVSVHGFSEVSFQVTKWIIFVATKLEGRWVAKMRQSKNFNALRFSTLCNMIMPHILQPSNDIMRIWSTARIRTTSGNICILSSAKILRIEGFRPAQWVPFLQYRNKKSLF